MQEFFTMLVKNINCTFNYILIINFKFNIFVHYTKMLMFISALFVTNTPIEGTSVSKMADDMFIFSVIVRINC